MSRFSTILRTSRVNFARRTKFAASHRPSVVGTPSQSQHDWKGFKSVHGIPISAEVHRYRDPSNTKAPPNLSQAKDQELSFEEVLALVSEGQTFALESTSSIEYEAVEAVENIKRLYTTKGREPNQNFMTVHGHRDSILSLSLKAAASAEKAGAHRDDVVAAFLHKCGYLIADWDADSHTHLDAAMPLYADRWLKKNGIGLLIRQPLKMQRDAGRYINTKWADSRVGIGGITGDFGGIRDGEVRGMAVGVEVHMSQKELELFESNIFKNIALSLAKWSEEALLQEPLTEEEENALLTSYSAHIKSHLLELHYGELHDSMFQAVH